MQCRHASVIKHHFLQVICTGMSSSQPVKTCFQKFLVSRLYAHVFLTDYQCFYLVTASVNFLILPGFLPFQSIRFCRNIASEECYRRSTRYVVWYHQLNHWSPLWSMCKNWNKVYKKTCYISLLINISYSLWQELHLKKQWGPYLLLKILLLKRIQVRWKWLTNKSLKMEWVMVWQAN